MRTWAFFMTASPRPLAGGFDLDFEVIFELELAALLDGFASVIERASRKRGVPAREGDGERIERHAAARNQKSLASCSGHHRTITLPRMYRFGTRPHSRLSELSFR
jgi:hypothetical protein